MHEQHGIAKPEAQATVDRWLSFEDEKVGPETAENSTE
jgi:hypothetical protein